VRVVRVPQPHEDERLLSALRRGDEAAFTELVERYNAPLLRFARTFVRDRAVAEEVVQETWLAVIGGLDRFEGRSLLKTWIFRILANRAKTRGMREARSVPFSALALDEEGDAQAVPEERFRGAGDQWEGHWATPPRSWDDVPESRLLARETREVIDATIEELPSTQAQVIRLRDVEGWSAEEVCDLLGLSEGNQRVLLHRARSKVRAALERYLD
jgi:RNA polymerase sigma-70 factor (ECF subfamily)